MTGLLNTSIHSGLATTQAIEGGRAKIKQQFGQIVNLNPRHEDALKIIGDLLEGNLRWVQGRDLHPHDSPDRRLELARTGQMPHVICLCCSDSRVNPIEIFDLGNGDIFAVESAGNLALEMGRKESLQLDSIAFMAAKMQDHSKKGLLVVLGHTDCGAIRSAASCSDPLSSPLRLLLTTVSTNIPAEVLKTPGEGFKDAAVANARSVLKSVVDNSSLIASAIQDGTLSAVAALYDVKDGSVVFDLNGIVSRDTKK